MYFYVSLKEKNSGLDFPNSYSSRQGCARINRQYNLPSRIAQNSGRDRHVNNYDNWIIEVRDSYKVPCKRKIKSTSASLRR